MSSEQTLVEIAQLLGNISARLEAGVARDELRDRRMDRFERNFELHLLDERKQNEALLELNRFMRESVRRKKETRRRFLNALGWLGSSLVVALGVVSQVWPEKIKEMIPWVH